VKNFLKKYIGNLFFSRLVYVSLSACSLLFLFRFFLSWLGNIPTIATGTVILLILLDYFALFLNRQGVFATRTNAERFSNGDENPVRLDVQNFYPFAVKVEVIDEVPAQFQRRDIVFDANIKARSSTIIQYGLRPVKRGEYVFGDINVYVITPLSLVKRRFRFKVPGIVPVYPSYLQMRKYQLMAISNRLSEVGVKKIRRVGHSMEFEQIKEYVTGDDYRTLNWKATARKGQLMVNHYTDEKSQQIYCVIDKGRIMKMPFDGLSLLDYAINASLVLSNVALLKQDKAGLITFSEQIGTFLAAEKKPTQMQAILESLHNQKTRYLESDFEKLYSSIRTKITQRSLLVLFTNFESLSGLRRQLAFLRSIARHHLLLVVFFENTELKKLLEKEAADIEDIYVKTVAERFALEKRRIVKELQQYGIISILTAPENVTVNTVNKYLELKARQAI
jgi:uncharacterized protein (DUF58 family)